MSLPTVDAVPSYICSPDERELTFLDMTQISGLFSRVNNNDDYFPGSSDSKESACNAGDRGSTPRSRRWPGEGNVYPLQCSCLKNSKDSGAWHVIVHGSQRVGHDWVTKT